MKTPNIAGRTIPTQPSRPRSLLRVLAIALALVLTLVATAVAIPLIFRYQQTQHLQESVDAAYTPAATQADQRYRDGQTILTELVGPVALEASATRCVISALDAGLVVRTWEVECVIRTVEVYRSDKTYLALAAQLEQESRAQGGDPLVLGNSTDVPIPPDGCGTLRGWSGDSLLEPSMRITRLAAGAFDPSELVDFTDYGCVVPPPVFDLLTTRIDSTFPAEEVSPEYSWVTVERETPFLRQDLKDGALAHAPSGIFTANAAWLTMTVIAFNLTRAAATLTSETLGRARTATIRRTLINVAARIANTARRWILHLPRDWPWQHHLENLIEALHTPPATATT